MNSSFTMDDMIEAKNKVLEFRRDQVMDFISGFSSDTEIQREDIYMDTVLVVSSELAGEYPYMFDIPFINVNKFMTRDSILITQRTKGIV